MNSGALDIAIPAAVARPEAEALDEATAEPRACIGELRVGGDGLDPAHEGRAAGVVHGGLREERARVHCSGLPCGVARRVLPQQSVI